jgi:hypothetical protein
VVDKVRIFVLFLPTISTKCKKWWKKRFNNCHFEIMVNFIIVKISLDQSEHNKVQTHGLTFERCKLFNGAYFPESIDMYLIQVKATIPLEDSVTTISTQSNESDSNAR